VTATGSLNPTVRLQRDGTALIITLDRPAVRNAIDTSVYDGVLAGYKLLDSDPELRVGVVTGAGGCFSAGMDLKAFAAGMRLGDAMVENRPRKPLIAAIEGFALAGGFELALACDVLISATDAVFGLPEITRGLVAAGGGMFRLPKRLPFHLAMRLILTGDTLPALRAAELGLVTELTEPGEALDAASKLARRIGSFAPLATMAATAVGRAAENWSESESWGLQQEIAASVLNSRDAREGSLAFAEKRSPRWTGS
jgi:enoyl-CoA hydratase